MDEAMAKAQLNRLHDELGDLLPLLDDMAARGFVPESDQVTDQVSDQHEPEAGEEDCTDLTSSAENVTVLPRAAE